MTRGLFDEPDDLLGDNTTKDTNETAQATDVADDPFGLPPLPEEDIPAPNAPPEYSVSEISQKLKQTVEDQFSFVRIRGEISRVTIAKSGHMYTSLKDDSAVLDAVCWRGTVNRLGLKPEEGMEVVCTGRLTTYPGRSNYQLIIETMELAGQGALLKMLEERKKKLAAEGLFDESRKRPIPFLPTKIGVITSPTGAVIRDIMHRLNERFPRRVLLWPVMVQGQGAAKTITDALNGFNAIPDGHPDKPNVLIVARGGGSLEDLMPFNDEALVRAVANSGIPVISAVGHETDTMLIDYAADLRAPTPTAAAEKAVPVRTEIMGALMDQEKRLFTSLMQKIKHDKVHLTSLGRGLTDPKRLMETLMQKMDHLNTQLDQGLQKWLDTRKSRIGELGGFLSPHHLLQNLKHHNTNVQKLSERLSQTPQKGVTDKSKQLENLSALLESLSFKRVLERGYSVVLDTSGKIISSSADAKKAKDMTIRFKDGDTKVHTK